MEGKRIKLGIAVDLQADVRIEPNACGLYVMDVSVGCPYKCIYCLISPLELMVCKLQHPGHKGDVFSLKLDKFLAREEFPPLVYLCYTSEPLANEEMRERTAAILQKLFAHDVHVLLVTKGVFSREILQVIRTRPELLDIQVGLSNFDSLRNRIIEPGAPAYEERLENFKELGDIKDLKSVDARIDPLFPLIDDTEENISRILEDLSKLGVKQVIFSYLLATRGLIDRLMKIDYTRASACALSERSLTLNQEELYSLPFAEKIKKFTMFQEMCRHRGMEMSICACREQRFKGTSFPGLCYPSLTKERREELSRGSAFKLDTSHL